MAKDLDTYLKGLQAAMTSAGADSALVQDALFDAEEYLRTEMAERYQGAPVSVEDFQARFAQVSEAYGSPEEVAAAYVGAPRAGTDSHAEMSTPPATQTEEAPPAEARPARPTPVGVAADAAAGAAMAAATGPNAWRRVFGVVVDPAVYKAWLYLLLSLGTGVAYFTIVVTGLSTSMGCLVLIVGIPLLLLVLAIVRGMSLIEGRLVEALLGTRMPRRERAELPEAGWRKRVGYWIKDVRTWASMAYMLLMLPLGIVYFTIAVTGLAAGLGLVATPFYHAATGRDLMFAGAPYHVVLPAWSMPLVLIAGLLVLFLWMHLVRAIGKGHAAFAKHMLVRLVQD